MKATPWFILPPLMEWYYKKNDPFYKDLPPLMDGCSDESVEIMEIVYPEWDSHIIIPRELDGSKGKVVLEVAHRNKHSRIFWHIDEQYIGVSEHPHQLAVDILPGQHSLTVIDNAGNSKYLKFEVLK